MIDSLVLPELTDVATHLGPHPEVVAVQTNGPDTHCGLAEHGHAEATSGNKACRLAPLLRRAACITHKALRPTTTRLGGDGTPTTALKELAAGRIVEVMLPSHGAMSCEADAECRLDRATARQPRPWQPVVPN